MSDIEWTGKTWNPLVGCTIHSAGCKGCYAMKDAWRLMHNPNAAIAAKFAGTAKMVNGHAVWTGQINFSADALVAPLRRQTPTVYFVNSMSDLFHQAVTDDQIDGVFAVMALCSHHTFQVLTKRADRMLRYLSDSRWPARVSALINAWPREAIGAGNEFSADFALCFGMHLPNVWLGVSVEDQRAADERIPDLLATPAAVRFLSCEPLIGPVNLNHVKFVDRETEGGGHEMGWESALNGLRFDLWAGDDEDPMKPGFPKLDWVICGGESGKTARPMHPDWARSLRDQCAGARVPFFFKQWGEWLFKDLVDPTARHLRDYKSIRLDEGTSGPFLRVGKKVAGRNLDGVIHDGMPGGQ